jgi:ribosomal protein L19
MGRLLGIDDLESIQDWQIRFAASWAEGRPVLVLFLALALGAIGVFFYLRYQNIARRRTAGIMAAVRAAILVLIAIILAEPVIALTFTERPRPLLLMLFDGSDSMNVADKLGDEEVEALATVTDHETHKTDFATASRLQLVRDTLANPENKVFETLAETFRIRAYSASELEQVVEVNASDGDEGFAPKLLAAQLKAPGQVTAIGSAIDDLRRRHRSHLLAGVVMFSDFDQNAGAPAVPAAERLGVPLFTVGVGSRSIIDLAVDLTAPLVLKKDEQVTVTVHLHQTGLEGRTANVELFRRQLGGAAGAGDDVDLPIGSEVVELRAENQSIEIPYNPDESGSFLITAKVTPFVEDVQPDNNSASRRVTVRDESLKLLFVEYEPTWEWRFIKEVFHRDPLIGREGFRTFLRSADFKVRRANDLFLDTLTRDRSEFFSYDAIFLSDVPAEMLTERFQNMLREYVKTFGGGLVVIGGPRFGPQALADTNLEEILPVVIDPDARIRNSEFALQLTPQAAEFPFMSLGEDEFEHRKAWANLDRLQWYQPVSRPHPLATVLANHPIDRCVDERTPQPLIAARRAGKGEVIYLGFNETWRLRRMYGEKYYRQFWGQMIYRLGLGRALGSQKRFQAATDQPSYQAGDRVRISVEAYNNEFEALDAEKLEGRLISIDENGQPVSTDITLPMSRDGVVFETTVPVFDAGQHRVMVTDPVTLQETELTFDVAPLAVERRNARRNEALQRALADQTGGKHYELHQIASLAADIEAPERIETSERRFPLWNTWLFLTLALLLMLGEWLSRKLINLR